MTLILIWLGLARAAYLKWWVRCFMRALISRLGMLKVPLRIMPVAPWFIFGKAMRLLISVGIRLLNCLYMVRVTVRTPVVPV